MFHLLNVILEKIRSNEKKYLVSALEATFIAQITRKLVRMIAFIESRMILSLDNLGSKTLCLFSAEGLQESPTFVINPPNFLTLCGTNPPL